MMKVELPTNVGKSNTVRTLNSQKSVANQQRKPAIMDLMQIAMQTIKKTRHHSSTRRVLVITVGLLVKAMQCLKKISKRIARMQLIQIVTLMTKAEQPISAVKSLTASMMTKTPITNNIRRTAITVRIPIVTLTMLLVKAIIVRRKATVWMMTMSESKPKHRRKVKATLQISKVMKKAAARAQRPQFTKRISVCMKQRLQRRKWARRIVRMSRIAIVTLRTKGIRQKESEEKNLTLSMMTMQAWVNIVKRRVHLTQIQTATLMM